MDTPNALASFSLAQMHPNIGTFVHFFLIIVLARFSLPLFKTIAPQIRAKLLSIRFISRYNSDRFGQL